MNEYESKQEEKKKRYQELSEKHKREADARLKAAREKLDMIPMGQPILVGHHSEKGHRAHLKRVDNDYRKAFEHQDTSKYYERKAKGVGKAGISSDDPEAIAKLKTKLESQKRNHQFMKDANKAIKRKDIEAGNETLIAMGLTQVQIDELRKPDFMGRIGFASYSLSNSNAGIHSTERRIAQLEAAQGETHQEFQHGEIKIVWNVDENRVQIFFPGKPCEAVRKRLKTYGGFRWSNYNKAWQRHLNNSGKYAATAFVEWLETERQGKWL